MGVAGVVTIARYRIKAMSRASSTGETQKGRQKNLNPPLSMSLFLRGRVRVSIRCCSQISAGTLCALLNELVVGFARLQADLARILHVSDCVDDLLLNRLNLGQSHRAQIVHLFVEHDGGPFRHISHDLFL